MANAKLVLGMVLWALLGALPGTAWAQEPSQQPLLTRATAVAPNLLILFDDSDSMTYGHLYSAKDREKPERWYNHSDPYSATETLYLSGDNRPLNADSYAYCSPDINKMAYNPARRYQPMKRADGTFEPQGSVSVMLAELAANDKAWKQCKVQWLGATYPRILRHNTTDVFYDPAKYSELAIIPGRVYLKQPKRSDCVANATSCSYNEEIQNYANWWTYHRTRLGVFKTALSHAMVTAPDSLRVGYTGINSFADTSTLTMAPVPLGFKFSAAEVSSMAETNRHLFYRKLKEQGTSPGTKSNLALTRAGLFFARKDSDGPWGTWPNPYSRGQGAPNAVGSTEDPTVHASCRRSYAMLATDGYYTELYPIGEKDSNQGATVLNDRNNSTYVYEPGPPYSSPHYGMADIAMHFWRADLRPDLNNNVAPILGELGDPAFWQHLNFIAVTLGLEGTLARTTTTLAALKSGAQAWPQPKVLAPEAMDDIWHATINGRGSLVNVTDSDDMVDAFTELVSGILRASASQGGVAASAVSLTSGTKKFIPVYTSGQWSGNLIATTLDPSTGREGTTLWQVQSADPVTGVEVPNTSKLGSHADRNIVVGTGGTTPRAVPFKHADMSAAGLSDLVSKTDAADIINYLRGDRTYESGTNDKFRKRAFVLGDIVNSNPTFVGRDLDQGYGKLAVASFAQDYLNYLKIKRDRTDGVVFIGANDGMLHAFRESDGQEIFAYVPHAVLPNLKQLADKNYTHRYFVDGQTTQGDFQHDCPAKKDTCNWRTAVIATAGAGAKSVFAIDATTNAMGTASVMWEVHSGMPDFEEMGNVLSEVRMGRKNGGQHIAVFGNGYYSKSGQAQLFVVNVKTGERIAKLNTNVGDGNGLGGVELVLNDNNLVVGAYAGDLKGNLWKFDLSSANADDWKVSTNPVFKAKRPSGAVQPITAAPLSIKHPDGGRVVVLGTGRFFDAVDVSTTDTQTIYGVRDRTAFTDMNSTSVDGTSTLVEQTLTSKPATSRIVTSFDETTSTQTVTYYEVSVNTINWTTNNGWYFNQPFTGQRMVYPVSPFANRMAKVDTITPSAPNSDPCIAATPGTGYNYLIDILTGGSPKTPILDTNGDGVVDSKDIVASGYSTTVDGRDVTLATGGTLVDGGSGNLIPPQCPPGGGPSLKFVIADSTGGSTVVTITCPYKGLKRRSWQQLFLR